MGTNQGDLATETPPAIHHSAPFAGDKFSVDHSRPKSLKRTREPTPNSPNHSNNNNNVHSGSVSPSKFARLTGQASRHSQCPSVPSPGLNEDGGWSEDDPTTQDALEKDLVSTIMGSTSIAASQDTPVAPLLDSGPEDQQAEHPSAVPTAVMAPPSNQFKTEASPQSSTSIPSMGGPGHVTTSPEAMDVDNQADRPLYAAPHAHIEERPASSMSYPPMPTTDGLPTTPNMAQRTSTHPVPVSQDMTPHSPSSTNKKHRCHFCETEFTRQHNLKSHLLTHSQEKPFECGICKMRFRRLHDLKRHTKLHTGEKPHICPKCDRKFARGDALARHSKGAGGCAGRRHSLPFDGDASNFEGQGNAEEDESGMTGVEYEGAPNEVEMSEEDRQRLGMANAYATAAAAAAHSRTYPPPGARSSGLYPPNRDRGAGNNNSNTPNNLGSTHAAIATASLYAQNAMTESPKPLSPHSGTTQPSQTQAQMHHPHHQHVHRRPSEGLSLPSSHNNGMDQPSKPSGIAGFAAPDSRYVVGTAGPTSASHSRNPSGPNVESGNMFSTDQIWSYISSLEDTVKQLADKVEVMEKDKNAQISRLANEVSALRQQLPEQRHETLIAAPAILGTKGEGLV